MSSALDKGHFAFGENWESYQQTVGEAQIEQSVVGLQALLPDVDWQASRWLDIGCGSGLSSLAAYRLGARSVTGIDVDENSVSASKSLLPRFGVDADIRYMSVFDATPDSLGTFDIVYSWGVLHHTGDMWRAIEQAVGLVAPGGTIALAFYRKTRFCPFWRKEKKVYSRAPRVVQAVVRYPFALLVLAAAWAVGTPPWKHVREYKQFRGMDFMHDMHDWLGGFPYESVAKAEILPFMERFGFTLVRDNVKPIARFTGLFGSGCDEYVFRRD